MRSFCFILFVACFMGRTNAQSLESLNINHWYDDTHEISFVLHPAVSGQNASVFYQLITNRREYPSQAYTIAWESRNSFNDRTAAVLTAPDSLLYQSAISRSGILTVPLKQSSTYVLAKITNTVTAQTYFYFALLDPQWPVDQFKRSGNYIDTRSYLPLGTTLEFTAPQKLFGFYYKNVFDAAQPPYVEAGSPGPFLIADSTFVFQRTLLPTQPGLYLVQQDSTKAQGLAFLVMDANYPKYTQVAQLAHPLVYITTDDEYLRLTDSKADKPAFDKVILDITRDRERAKNLMRSYFQRIESANRYFTDYKEGWKTDRGMLYIIYGKPDEVSRTATSETWYYQTRKTRFTFHKSGSVFNPENYKLERDEKFMIDWFSMVDLWRKSRF
jgi:GWxTD domain-containing protein